LSQRRKRGGESLLGLAWWLLCKFIGFNLCVGHSYSVADLFSSILGLLAPAFRYP